MSNNKLRYIREALMWSKEELSRKANVSSVTITRIEKGHPCRLETKRKILLAFGYHVSDMAIVFDN